MHTNQLENENDTSAIPRKHCGAQVLTMFRLINKLGAKLRDVLVKIITESLLVYIYYNDYCIWRVLHAHLPAPMVTIAFRVFTFFQLYFLGARYLLKEVYRKISPNVRKLSAHEPDMPDDIRGYVVIVTGGSRGIGLSVAKHLYGRGATVIVTSSMADESDRQRMASLFRNSVTPRHSGGDIFVWQIDFRDLATVCHFAARFRKSYDHLEVVVNNAGIMFASEQRTVNGLEYHYQINYLSHALLTWLVMPALAKAKSPARIVNVSSSTHYPRPAFLEDLQSRHTPYSPFHAYAQSKLCQIMITYFMADWLSNGQATARPYSRVLVNCLHPGVAKTELYVNVWWVKMFPALARLLFRTADEGAETVVYLALSDQVKESGHYYEDCAQLRSSKFSRCKTNQARLAQITRQQLAEPIELFNRDYPSFKMPAFLEQ